MKGMNTSYSLLLKAGGLVIYRVLMGSIRLTIEAIEDSELLLNCFRKGGINECTTCFERYQDCC
jgi:hypothetical protein